MSDDEDVPFTQPSGVPTIDEIRTFLHKQIAEVRAMGQREGEDVTDRVNEVGAVAHRRGKTRRRASPGEHPNPKRG
jgi:hypothetical protein